MIVRIKGLENLPFRLTGNNQDGYTFPLDVEFPEIEQSVEVATQGVAPYPPRLRPAFEATGGNNPMWMGPDGAIYIANQSQLYKAKPWANDPADREQLGSFGYAIEGVRTLDDGELLVSILNNEGSDTKGEVWRSTDGQTNWQKVLDSSSTKCRIHGFWGMSAYGDIVVLSEYGSKTPPGNARFVYLSTDMGFTFEPVYDHGEHENAHVHGSAFDPYRNLIWVTTGDVGYRSIQYSYDWGQSWVVVTNDEQPVVPIPMRDCILFGTDGPVNGLLRVTMRDKGEVPKVEVAYQIDDGIGGLNYVARQPFRLSEKHPLYVGFTGSKAGKTGKILATMDGYHIYEVWSDHIPDGGYDGIGGVHTVLGPTEDGKLMGYLGGDKRFPGYTFWQADAPEWE